jgi:8-oxo-dGTP diphosphatase
MYREQSGVVVIIMQNHKYLLVKQNKDPYKNFWGPVHGTIELAETEEEAIVREVREEIGIIVTPIRKLGCSPADYKVIKLHWWLAKNVAGNININNNEISDFGYFSLNELLNLQLLPETRNFFERITEQNPICSLLYTL